MSAEDQDRADRERHHAVVAERDDLATRLRSVEIVRDLMRTERDRLRGLLERALRAAVFSPTFHEEVRDALAEIRGDEAPRRPAGQDIAGRT